ncbi:MAG: hypothetical protein ACLFUY_02925 [Desulfobacterales bacterium]
MNTAEKEKTELTHQPVKGYPAALYAAVAVALAYLAYVFIASI